MKDGVHFQFQILPTRPYMRMEIPPAFSNLNGIKRESFAKVHLNFPYQLNKQFQLKLFVFK